MPTFTGGKRKEFNKRTAKKGRTQARVVKVRERRGKQENWR